MRATRANFIDLADESITEIMGKLTAHAVIERRALTGADQFIVLHFAGRNEHASFEGEREEDADQRLELVVIDAIGQTPGVDFTTALLAVEENAGAVARSGAAACTAGKLRIQRDFRVEPLRPRP